MSEKIQMRVSPEVAASDMRLRAEVSTQTGADINRIKGLAVRRRSIDARQRRVMVNLEVEAWLDREPAPEELCPVSPVAFEKLPADAPRAVVVGAGPAGLFAALRLIELGVRPVVLERGKSVEERARDMGAMSRPGGVVNPDSNYCFGEGGAGAYSDGKLYTRSHKRGSVEKILNILAQHGADERILVDTHPHIGTDRLPQVIRAIRRTILDCGGEIHFSTRVERLLLDAAGTEVAGVVTADGAEYRGPVILATGHSARDVYGFLQAQGVRLEPKGIAVGVRLEHPQELIDRLQYHSPKGRGPFLPPAEYSLLTRVDGRAVYSFCMCPGGVVIPAATSQGQIVVNGMSPAARGTRWANSGMVVEVLPDDPVVGGDPADPLRVMRFQQRVEEKLWADNPEGGQNAPAQRMTDFVASRPSASLPRSSYAPGLHPARLDQLLPAQVARRLQEGFRQFDRSRRGFLTDEAVLIGAETRTSAPVRVTRAADTLQSLGLRGLYPAGEGAGYAGGIVSAAIDGARCALALAQAYSPASEKVSS